ncbi:MAG TPA: hypothetical protein VFZ40_03780 [Pyrinomonadaceae bacterium]
MSSEVISCKWRPQTFEQVSGQGVLTPKFQDALIFMSHQANFRRHNDFLLRVVLALVVVAVSGLAFVPSASGQSPAAAPPYGPAHVGGYDPIKEELDRRQPRTFFPRRNYGPAKEDRVVKKGLLAPSLQDRADYADFLKQSGTGLIKLLPREVYDWRAYGTEKHLNLKGGGAYYSFFYRTHEPGYGSDLELDHNKFTVGGAGGYGMLVKLGDVSLHDVSLRGPGVDFIAQYRPVRAMPDLRCELKRFQDGVELGGLVYRSSLPVEVNSTYLLRSISYGRSDLLVAYRVTRQDRDGSVILAWKLLKQYSEPRFEKVLYLSSPDKCPIK